MLEFRGTDRFEVKARIGKGGMGVVYRVFDRERETVVALKTLLESDPDGIARIKREFRALAGIAHKNLVGLHELFYDEGQYFFTMELIDGTSFLAYARGFDASDDETTRRPDIAEAPPTETANQPLLLRPAPPDGVRPVPAADHERMLSALRQLARGINAIHAAGKMHRDLKPANVMVTREGRVVILDFGLMLTNAAVEAGHDEDASAGTPHYMSPEQHLGRPSSAASDWYSFGVMMYEALTGCRPFRNLAVLRAGEPVHPPSVGTLLSGLPPKLVILCDRLLRWHPAERPNGAEVLRVIGERADEDTRVRSPGAGDSIFVGRQRQLDALRDAFHAAHRRPVIVRVSGVSGFGKTTLVRQWLTGILPSPANVVLTGRCYERESLPYKVFDSLIDGLCRYLKTLPIAELVEVLPHEIRSLARLFPVLLSIEAIADAPIRDVDKGDPLETARRASAALRDLLGRIAVEHQVVLFVDDLQWGDVDSVRLLSDLLAEPAPPSLLLVVTYRAEEVGRNPVLGVLLEVLDAPGDHLDRRTIDVAALDSAEARELATRFLERSAAEGTGRTLTAASVDAVVREAAGSPLFAQELARHVNDEPMEHVQLADVLRQRVARLPDDARMLLEATVVAGRPIAQESIMAASQLGARVDDALLLLQSTMLVRTSGVRRSDLIETYHDKIREAVLGMLDEGRLREWHRRIASTLRADDPDALAWHWENAGDAENAVRYALLAAERAARALAFDRAADLYATVLRLSPADGDRRAEHQARMGDALCNAGRAPEAAESYLAAATREKSPTLALDLNRRAFEQLLISGHVDRGREIAGGVLKAVGLRLPAPNGALLSFLLQRAKLTLRGVAFNERPEAEVAPDVLERLEICWAMATGLSIVDTKLGADFTTRYLLYALDSGEPIRIARGLAMEGTHQASSGAIAKAKARLAAAEELANRFNDPHSQGLIKLMRGFVNYFEGRYDESLAHFDSAESQLREQCTGVTWELTTAGSFAIWALFYSGRWAELAHRGPRLLEKARRQGNLYMTHGLRISAGIVSRLMDDDVDAADRELREASASWSAQGFQVQNYLELFMHTWVRLYAGEGQAAFDAISRGWPLLRRSLLLQVETIRYAMLTARAFSALAAQPNEKLLRLAEADAQRLSRFGDPVWAPAVASSLRAAVAFRRGDRDAAIGLLERAASVFESANMILFGAAMRRQQGRLMGDDGRQRVAEATAMMASQSIRSPGRVTRMLAPGFDDEVD